MKNTSFKTYIVVSAIKKEVKSMGGKRVSKDFLEALNRYVHKKLIQAVQEHNGGKKTLDAAVAGYILGKV